MMGEFERRVVGAIREGGASRMPAKSAAGRCFPRDASRGAPGHGRRTPCGSACRAFRCRTARDRIVYDGRLGQSRGAAGPTGPDDQARPAEAAAQAERKAARRPEGSPPAASGRAPGDQSNRLDGADAVGRSAQETPRRIAKSDWNGAYNVFFARRDAAALPRLPHDP